MNNKRGLKTKNPTPNSPSKLESKPKRKPRKSKNKKADNVGKPEEVVVDPLKYEYDVRTSKGNDGTPVPLVPRSEITFWAMNENDLFTKSQSFITELGDDICSNMGYEETTQQKRWKDVLKRVELRKQGIDPDTIVAEESKKVDDDVCHPLLEFIRTEKVKDGNKKEICSALNAALSIKEFASTLEDIPELTSQCEEANISILDVFQTSKDPEELKKEIPMHERKHIEFTPHQHITEVIDLSPHGKHSKKDWNLFLQYSGCFNHMNVNPDEISINEYYNSNARIYEAYTRRIESRDDDYWATKVLDAVTGPTTVLYRSRTQQTDPVELKETGITRNNRNYLSTKRAAELLEEEMLNGKNEGESGFSSSEHNLNVSKNSIEIEVSEKELEEKVKRIVGKDFYESLDDLVSGKIPTEQLEEVLAGLKGFESENVVPKQTLELMKQYFLSRGSIVYRLKWHCTALQRMLMIKMLKDQIKSIGTADISNPLPGRTLLKPEGEPLEADSMAEEEGKSNDSMTKKTNIEFLFSFQIDTLKTYSVTYIEWCSQNPNVFVAGYSNTDNLYKTAGDGYVVAYSFLCPEFPRRVYKINSPVEFVRFNEKNCNLVAAGTKNGEIYVFNIRSNSEEPLVDNLTCASRHRYGVYSLTWGVKEQVSTSDEEEYVDVLLTTADDGIVRLWNLNRKMEVEEIMKCKKMTRPGDRRRKKEALLMANARATCLELDPLDNKCYYIGTDEGWIHRCSLQYHEQYIETYNGHRAPVTAVKFSPFDANVFASTGEDWQVMIWKRSSSNPSLMLSIADLRIGYKDIVWSPFNSTHLLALRDIGIEIWDLALDTLNPFAIARAGVEFGENFVCAAWGPQANLVSVGDTIGRVNLFKLAIDPNSDENNADALDYTIKEAASLSLLMGNYYAGM